MPSDTLMFSSCLVSLNLVRDVVLEVGWWYIGLLFFFNVFFLCVCVCVQQYCQTAGLGMPCVQYCRMAGLGLACV